MSGPFDDLIPQKAPGAIAPKGMIYSPPADSLGQQQKAVTLGKSATEAQIAASTQADTIREAHAKADKAVTDAQAAKDKLLAETGVPAPGNTQLTGEDYLKTIPPQTANQARAMIEGRTPYPTGAALRSPQMQTVIAAAQQADPTYNYANAITRLKTRQDFTSGTTAKNVTAINTALGHLGQLMADAQALKNTGSPLINAPINAVRSGVLGSGKFTALSSDVQAVSDELERAFKGANGTETGVKGWETKFSENSSPDQFLQGGQAVAKLLMGRLENVTDQYNRGMSRASDPMTFLNPHAQAVLSAVTSGNLAAIPSTLPKGFDRAPLTSAWLPGDHGSPPPPPAGGDTPPPTLGSPPKAPPGGLGGIPQADYSGIGGGPNMAAATGGTRNVYNPIVSAKLNALIHAGKPVEEGNAILPSGTPPIDAKTWDAAVSYASNHKNWNAAEATQSIPTTLGERLSASAPAAAIAGFGAGSTAGLQDVLGRTLAGPQWDANRAAIAAMHPIADTAGNIAGGVAGSLAAPELLAKYAPGASRALGAFAEANPIKAAVGGDALFGGAYGASENPDHPVSGGLLGAVTGAGAGMAGRKLTGGIASAISPSAGPFAPLYAAGGSPTIGQKLSATGGVTGKIVNTAEQAMQSFPGLGMMVAGARQAPRDAAQIGAFNNALGELAPFGNAAASSLPKGVGPGTVAHAFTSDQFGKAYDLARSGMQFVPDQQYMSEANALSQKVGSGVLSPDQAKQVGDVVNNAVVGRLQSAGGALNGDAYKAASSDLGSAIRTWGKNPSTAPMADALSDYATIFDNAARRNSDPAAVNLLDSADRGYAQFVRIQRASELGGAGKEAGTFSPLSYAQATKQMGGGVRSNAYNQGNALGQDYANAILPLRDTLPNSGTSERLLTSQALAGLGGGEIGAGGFLAAHPGSLAPFAAYIPGVRDLVAKSIAPNAQRLSFMPPPAVASIDALGSKLDDLAPFIGKGAIPGALAYFGGGQ